MEVHRVLGPGLLESAYEACLAYELEQRRLAFLRQVALPVRYKGVKLDCGYRLDFVVEEELIVELKTVEALAPIHLAQVITYLKLTGLAVGLLVNFRSESIRRGLRRVTVPHRSTKATLVGAKEASLGPRVPSAPTVR